MDLATLKVMFEADMTSLKDTVSGAQDTLTSFSDTAKPLTNVTFTGDSAGLTSATDESKTALQGFKDTATGLSTVEFKGDAAGLTTATDQAKGTLDGFKETAAGVSMVEFKGDTAGLTTATDQAKGQLDSFKTVAAEGATVNFRGTDEGLVSAAAEARGQVESFKTVAAEGAMVEFRGDETPLRTTISEADASLTAFHDEATALGDISLTANTTGFTEGVSEARTETSSLADELVVGEASGFQFAESMDKAGEKSKESADGAKTAEAAHRGLGTGMEFAKDAAFTFAGVAGLLAVIDGMKGVVTSAIDMQAAMGQGQRVMVAMGSTTEEASAHLKELRAFAESGGLDFPQLQDADQRMMTFGVSASETIPILHDAANAALAMGKGQEGVQAITDALGKMQETGIVSSRTLTALATNGVDIYHGLATVLNTDVAGAMQAVKDKTVDSETIMQAFKVATQGMGDQFTANAATMSGSMNKLKENLGEVVGAGITPFRAAVAGAVGSLADFVGRADVKDFLLGIGSAATTAAGAMSSLVSGGFGLIVSAVSSLSGPLASVTSNLTVFAGIVAGVAAAIASTFLPSIGGIVALLPEVVPMLAGLATGAAAAASSFIVAAAPIVAVGVAVAGLVIGGIALYNWLASIPAVTDAVSSAFASVQGALSTVGAAIVSFGSSALQWLKDRWADIAPAAQSALSGLSSAFTTAMAVITPVVQAGISVVTSVFQTLWPIVQQTAVMVGQTLVAAWQTLQPVIAPIVDLLGGGLIGALTTIAVVIGGVVVVGIVALVAALTTIAVVVAATVAAFALLVRGALAIGDGINAAINWLNNFRGVLPILGTAASSAASAIGSAFSSAYNAVVNWLGQAVAYVRSWGASVVSAVSSVAAPIVAAVQAGWQRVVQITQTVLGPIATVIRYAFLLGEAAILLAYTVISSYVSAGWQRVVSLTQSVLAPVGSFVSDIWNGIVSIISTVLTTVEGAVSTGWQFVSDETTSIWTAVQAYLQSWWDWLVSTATSYLTNIETLIQTGWQYVSDTTNTIWTAVQTFLQTWWDWLVGLVTPYVQNIETLIQTGWQWISDTTNTIWSAIRDFFTQVWTDIKTVFNDTVNGLETFLSDAWTTISTAATDGFHKIAHAIVDPMVDAVNTVMDVISSLGTWLAKELDSWGVGASIASALRAGAPSHVANPLPFAEGGFRGAGEVDNQSFATGGVSSGTPGYTDSRQVEWGEDLGPGQREYFLTEKPEHAPRNASLWAEYGQRMGFARGGMMESFATGGTSPDSVQNIFGGPGNADISQVANTGRGVTINPTHSFSATQSVNQSPGTAGSTSGAGAAPSAAGTPSAAGGTGMTLPPGTVGLVIPTDSWKAAVSDDAAGNAPQLGIDLNPTNIQVLSGLSSSPIGSTAGNVAATDPNATSTPVGSATGGATSGLPSTSGAPSSSASGATGSATPASSSGASTTPGKWYSTTGITSGMVPTNSLRWMPPPPSTSSTGTSTGTTGTGTTGSGTTGGSLFPNGLFGGSGTGTSTGTGTGTSAPLGSPGNPYPNSPPQSGGVPAGVDPAYYGYPADSTVQSGLGTTPGTVSGGIPGMPAQVGVAPGVDPATAGLPADTSTVNTGAAAMVNIAMPTSMWTAVQADEQSGNTPQLLIDFDPSQVTNLDTPSGAVPGSTTGAAPTGSSATGTGSAAPSGAPSGGRSVLSGTNSGTNTLNQTAGSPTSSNFQNVSLTSNTTSQLRRFATGGFDVGAGEVMNPGGLAHGQLWFSTPGQHAPIPSYGGLNSRVGTPLDRNDARVKDYYDHVRPKFSFAEGGVFDPAAIQAAQDWANSQAGSDYMLGYAGPYSDPGYDCAGIADSVIDVLLGGSATYNKWAGTYEYANGDAGGLTWTDGTGEVSIGVSLNYGASASDSGDGTHMMINVGGLPVEATSGFGVQTGSTYSGDVTNFDQVMSLSGGTFTPAAGGGGGVSGSALGSALNAGGNAILSGAGAALAPAGQVGAGLASVVASVGKSVIASVASKVGGAHAGGASAGVSADVASLIAKDFPADAQSMADTIVGRESGGDPSAYNASGASGLFQILPSTAEGLGGDPSQLFDPAYNVQLAAQLYAQEGWAPWSETAFGEGGIVTSPTLGLVGETGQDEAVIPLPAGATDFVEKMSHGPGDTSAIARQLADLKATVEKQHAMDRAHGTHITNTGELAQMGAASAHAALASDAGKETMDKNISQSLGYFNNYLGDTV